MPYKKNEMRVLMTGKHKGTTVRVQSYNVVTEMYDVALPGGTVVRTTADNLGTVKQGEKLDEYEATKSAAPVDPEDLENAPERGPAIEPRSGGTSGPDATTAPTTD